MIFLTRESVCAFRSGGLRTYEAFTSPGRGMFQVPAMGRRYTSNVQNLWMVPRRGDVKGTHLRVTNPRRLARNPARRQQFRQSPAPFLGRLRKSLRSVRSEEHTSELQSHS